MRVTATAVNDKWRSRSTILLALTALANAQGVSVVLKEKKDKENDGKGVLTGIELRDNLSRDTLRFAVRVGLTDGALTQWTEVEELLRLEDHRATRDAWCAPLLHQLEWQSDVATRACPGVDISVVERE